MINSKSVEEINKVWKSTPEPQISRPGQSKINQPEDSPRKSEPRGYAKTSDPKSFII